MINKIIFLFFNFFYNNKIIFDIRKKKFDIIDYNYDFINISFENLSELKKIFFSKKYLNNRFYDENSISYHYFEWLYAAKKIGGLKNISLAKKHIFNWHIKKYRLSSFVWEKNFVAKRLINLIYNFDYYAVSATKEEKKILNIIILKHYFILNLLIKLNKNDVSIEITKAMFLFHLIHKLETSEIVKKLNKQLNENINQNGMHKSMNPCTHAEFINHLYEIKNICLFFNFVPPKEIEFQITNMSAVLKNLFHKDGMIALFNGSNNANIESITKINKLINDITAKNLAKIKNGLAIFENNKFKVFFDAIKPDSKLLNQNLHAGTLGFEMSCDKEKIITNCGSVEKRIGKKPEYLRFSAAHSTIILNNTNISELVEKKSYKRIPKIILLYNEETENILSWSATHDGYMDNFRRIIKRKLIISKNYPTINGEDSIICHKLNSKKALYNIRFHLTPICTCLLTNNQKSVLIKTKLNQSWIFSSENKLKLEESIYINNGKRVERTKQIVISGYTSLPKKIEKWSISKINT